LEDSLQLAAGSSNFPRGLSSLKKTQKLKIKNKYLQKTVKNEDIRRSAM